MKHLSLDRLAWALVAFHAAISLFGVVGIAVMMPNPQIWSGSPALVAAFPVSVQWGGNLQIIAGAAALFVYGMWALGTRPTVVFFIVSVIISLILELTGTGFGWPFGAYDYTGLFGYKILDQVPPSIPLSWFYMGLASFLLAKAMVRNWIGRASIWPAIIIGAVLLAGWDLVLDPAMSHPTMLVQYWIWEDTGPYLGMPLVNILGWIATGALFTAVACFFNADLASPEVDKLALPLAVYAVNILFGVGICLGAGLWLPLLVGFVLLGVVFAGVLWPLSVSRLVRGEA